MSPFTYLCRPRCLVIFLFALVLTTLSTTAAKAQELQDVVYLKDGSVIRGVIVEQVPGASLLIETREGNRFRYQMDQVERLTREPIPSTSSRNVSPRSPAAAGLLSALIVGAGQGYNGEWGKAAGFAAGAILLGGAAISSANSDECYYYNDCGTAGMFALGWLAVGIWSIADAVSSARAINRELGLAFVELAPEIRLSSVGEGYPASRSMHLYLLRITH